MMLSERSNDYILKVTGKSSPLQNLVVVTQSCRADYGPLNCPIVAPELPDGLATTVPVATLRELFQTWCLDTIGFGSTTWNPLGRFISPGSAVVIKPNWVFHSNRSGDGLDCLLTHTAVLEAILEYVALAKPSSVVLGDAPVQGCDFQLLRRTCGIDKMAQRFLDRGMKLNVCDFRHTILPSGRLGGDRVEAGTRIENFVLFDLKTDSLLEPISADAENFRVTMYDPQRMLETHAPGRHQYLIARELLEADTVLNVPKLKTHKKACITGALKNIVGINGHKEYLPHHRKGGSQAAGDCYEGSSSLKGQVENLLDAANRSHSRGRQAVLARSADALLRVATFFGEDSNVEGSWYGNDTVWRMCLDLQRILRYGRIDGTLSETPQRNVISITDAIIAGEGEGPMAPTRVPVGFLTGATNPAAAEWVHARLMGFDPRKIPLVREAFSKFPHAIADCEPGQIRIRFPENEISEEQVFPVRDRAFQAARGWKGHCELEAIHDRVLS